MKIMAKNVWLIPVLISVLVGIILVWYWFYRNKPAANPEEIKQIILEEVVFDVELATTPQERARGLSGRSQLCDQCGMLFIFDKSDYHSFWMKDTLIPLDIIWFDENWRVVDYLAFAQPQGARKITELPVYRPKKPAQFVLELPGGTTKKIKNFQIGDQAKPIY